MWSLGVCVYLILFGELPFIGCDDQHIMRNILDIEPLFLTEDCPNLSMHERPSPEARDFVRRCLVKDPQLRMSPLQGLDHDWLNGRVPACGVITHERIESARKTSLKMKRVPKRVPLVWGTSDSDDIAAPVMTEPSIVTASTRVPLASSSSLPAQVEEKEKHNIRRADKRVEKYSRKLEQITSSRNV
eukprot:Platyproteum_vivax@DN5020_c0_g1_i1.p1